MFVFNIFQRSKEEYCEIKEETKRSVNTPSSIHNKKEDCL
jgi:hypothetical protein